jgi:hypothetical protein
LRHTSWLGDPLPAPAAPNKTDRSAMPQVECAKPTIWLSYWRSEWIVVSCSRLTGWITGRLTNFMDEWLTNPPA